MMWIIVAAVAGLFVGLLAGLFFGWALAQTVRTGFARKYERDAAGLSACIRTIADYIDKGDAEGAGQIAERLVDDVIRAGGRNEQT